MAWANPFSPCNFRSPEGLGFPDIAMQSSDYVENAFDVASGTRCATSVRLCPPSYLRFVLPILGRLTERQCTDRGGYRRAAQCLSASTRPAPAQLAQSQVLRKRLVRPMNIDIFTLSMMARDIITMAKKSAKSRYQAAPGPLLLQILSLTSLVK